MASGLSYDDKQLESYLLESIQESVIATDLSGSIIYWNKGAEKLYQWSKEEVMGKIIHDIIPSKISQELGVNIFARLLKGEPWTGQFLVRRRDGYEFQALVTDRPIMLNNQLVGIVGTSVDMSSELVRHQIATSAVAHELRAPVSGMIGMIRGIIEESRKVEAEDLEILLLASNTLLNFVNNLIELPVDESVSSPPILQKCVIRKALKVIIDTMKPLGREDKISVTMNVSINVPDAINIVLIKFQQAFFNLLSNAFKYTKTNSKISIQVYSSDMDDLNDFLFVEGKTPPPISFDPNISYVFVSVKDQGKGILPEELPILFSSYGKLPNKTVEGSHVSELCGSTGLGLFNCKNFLGRLGGCVWVSWSQVDAGSEFTFAMPYNDCIDDLESISLSSDSYLPLSHSRSEYGSNAPQLITPTGNSQSQSLGSHRLNQSSNNLENESISNLSNDILSCSQKSDSETNRFEMKESMSTHTTNESISSQTSKFNTLVFNDLPDEQRISYLKAKLNVLVCDDDPISRKILTNILKHLNVIPITARNGAEALDTILTRKLTDSPIHVLFIDLNMPIMNGYECSSNIRETLGDLSLPVICALSASHVNEVVDKCIECGITYVETKPISSERLKIVLNDCISQAIQFVIDR